MAEREAGREGEMRRRGSSMEGTGEDGFGGGGGRCFNSVYVCHVSSPLTCQPSPDKIPSFTCCQDTWTTSQPSTKK